MTNYGDQRARVARNKRKVLERLERRVLMAAGQLDPTFGSGGTVFGASGATREAYDVAVLGDGRVLAVGDGYGTSSQDFTIARYDANGSPDSTFGPNGDGVVHTDFWGLDDRARTVHLLAGGKFLVGGTATAPDGRIIALARYRADGSLDTTFGNNGRAAVRVGPDDAFADLVMQPDGKIVAVGDTQIADTSDARIPSGRDIAIARFNFDGSLDTTFGDGDGIAIVSFEPRQIGLTWGPKEDIAQGVALQSTGKIVILSTRGESPGFQMARLSAEGVLDTTFAEQGRLYLINGASSVGGNVVVQAGDALLISGTVMVDGIAQFYLRRYLADGMTDGSFGSRGPGQALPLFDTTYSHALGLGLQPDGKIVQVGRFDGHVAIVRYTASGALDTTFGQGGLVLADLGGTIDMPDSARAVAFAPNGDIVVAGGRIGGYSFAIGRYLSEPPPGDTTILPAYPVIINHVSGAIVNSRGLLRVVGTDGDDSMSIEPSLYGYRIQSGTGSFLHFDLSSVSEILIVGLGGNDRITIDAPYPVQVMGGDGNDTIIGGTGNDTLIGNNGKDLIDGREGDDRIDGYGGHDHLVGNLGNDRVYGGSGVDLLEGGAGNDRLHAGIGDDVIGGGGGADTLYGEAGGDTIAGGSGGAGTGDATDHALDVSLIDTVFVNPASASAPLAVHAPLFAAPARRSVFDDLEASGDEL